MMEDFKLTTGRLFWTPLGETSWIDLGNAVKYKRMEEVKRISHERHEDGFAQVDFELPNVVKSGWQFTFDEFFGERLKLLHLSKDGVASQVNGGGPTPIAAFASASLAVGRSLAALSIGGVHLQGVEVISASDGVITLVEGTHYAIDRNAGMVTVLSIPNPGNDWQFSLTWTARINERFTALGQLLTRGTFRVVEKDQGALTPRNMEDFMGQCFVTAWGEADGSKFEEYQLDILFNPVS